MIDGFTCGGFDIVYELVDLVLIDGLKQGGFDIVDGIVFFNQQ